eukprot:m.77365 g.77365  ORF g.77365 m.77365 type:complete len:534 (+) comp8135_c0_seq1:423-2024(+)
MAFVREGYLVKRGGAIRSWKKRWFALNAAGELSYAEAKGRSPIRVIPPHQILAIVPGPECNTSWPVVDPDLCFGVKTANRTYCAYADAAPDALHWRAALITMLLDLGANETIKYAAAKSLLTLSEANPDMADVFRQLGADAILRPLGAVAVQGSTTVLSAIAILGGDTASITNAPAEAAVAPDTSSEVAAASPRPRPESEFDTDDDEDAFDDEYACPHYKRRCLLKAPCCGKFVRCRLCHDADGTCDVEMDRHAVETIKCLACDTEQPVARRCINCKFRFALYFCAICRLYDTAPQKQQFHCDGCGICRLGGRENFEHCDKCCVCYRKTIFKNHKCIDKAMGGNCPVCLEFLHTSTTSITVPRCGHILHRDCQHQLLKQSRFICPICSQSYVDLPESVVSEMDREIAETPMPPPLRNSFVGILCNDCHRKSVQQYHILGHKCPNCSSYNTVQISGPGAAAAVAASIEPGRGASDEDGAAATTPVVEDAPATDGDEDGDEDSEEAADATESPPPAPAEHDSTQDPGEDLGEEEC